MNTLYINQDISGKKLVDLLTFAIDNSTKISIANFHIGKCSQSEINSVQEEYKAYILESDKKCRQSYKENSVDYTDNFHKTMNIHNEKEAYKYFDERLERELENLEELDSDVYTSKELIVYNFNNYPLLYKKLTRITPVTRGALWELYFFAINDKSRELVMGLCNLFSFPFVVEGYEFEDLAFYQDEREILAICSHEKFASLLLSDEEYSDFLKLDINHNIN